MTKLVDQLLMKTGSTDVLIGSSTGGLYHQGVVLPNSTLLSPLSFVTWPSTAAQTLVNTTSVQDLTNKTLNAGTSPSTATHTLVGTTATQALTNKTLNAGTSPTTGTHVLVGTTSVQTLENKTLGVGTIQNTETGSTAASLVNYGVSLLAYSSDAGKAYTLGAPAIGVTKVLVLQTTAVPDTTGVFSSVYTGSTAIFIMDNSTTYAPKLYAGFGPPYARVELEGHSTALWGVVSAYGNAKFSTSAVFST